MTTTTTLIPASSRARLIARAHVGAACLAHVEEHQPVTVKPRTLAQSLEVDPSLVYRALVKLEADGLIERENSSRGLRTYVLVQQ